MILYAQILFGINVLALLFYHEDVALSHGDRAVSFLIVSLPIFGRLFGWW